MSSPASAAPIDVPEPRRAKKIDSFFWPSIVIMVVAFLGSILADAMGGAAPALAVVWVPLVLYGVFQAPPHLATRVLFLLALFLEPTDENPGAGYWISPLKPVSDVYYASMHRMGIPGMSLPLVFFLGLVLLYRAKNAKKPSGYVPAPKQAVQAMLLFVGALAALELYGMLNGGDMKPSFRQFLHMLHFGVLGLAFLYGIRGPRDLRALGTIIVVSAIAKGLLVIWVYEVICRPLNIKPAYATTHSDSVLFAAAILVLGTDLIERRAKKQLLRLLGLGLFFIVAIVMNNRRLAMVGVAGGAAVIFSVLKASAVKRKVITVVMAVAPVLVGYVLIGGSSKAAFFMPAALITSVIEQKDSSSETRDIENYNLIATMKKHPILGPGLGHEYIEFVKAEDISAAFPLYRFIGHNSVLWIWSFGGLIGFSSLWIIHGIGVFLAARGYRLATSSVERSAGLTALAVIFVCMLQEWGDMGICAFSPMVLLAMSYAVGAKLCGAAAMRSAELSHKKTS